MDWQVQEAKQRFSELLRRVHEDGPQMITRHGEEVAVVVDIAWFREKSADGKDLGTFLTEMPHVPGLDEVLAEIERERHQDFSRPIPEIFDDEPASRP